LAGEDRTILYGYRTFSTPSELLDLLTEILQNPIALDDWLKGTRLAFDTKVEQLIFSFDFLFFFKI
jgi:hypothetical protein